MDSTMTLSQQDATTASTEPTIDHRLVEQAERAVKQTTAVSFDGNAQPEGPKIHAQLRPHEYYWPDFWTELAGRMDGYEFAGLRQRRHTTAIAIYRPVTDEGGM